MFKTRDECMEAVLRDNEMLPHSTVGILYQPSTDTYRYTPDYQHGESGESLYAILHQFPYPRQWDFKPMSAVAREYLENNPLPGKLIIGNAS